jgi:hypothetical protein
MARSVRCLWRLALCVAALAACAAGQEPVSQPVTPSQLLADADSVSANFSPEEKADPASWARPLKPSSPPLPNSPMMIPPNSSTRFAPVQPLVFVAKGMNIGKAA